MMAKRKSDRAMAAPAGAARGAPYGSARSIAAAVLSAAILASCTTSQRARLAAFDYVAAHEKANPGSQSIRFEDLSPDEPLMKKVFLSGSYRELGREIGRVARGTPIKPSTIANGDRALNDGIRALYARIYPQHLEIAAGVAEALGLDPDDVDLRSMERRFFIELGWLGFDYQRWTESGYPVVGAGCSIAAVDTANGELVGRNFDWRYAPGFVVDARLEGSYRSIGNTIIAPQHWVMDGLNERGLFIGVMTVSAREWMKAGFKPYPAEPAVNAHHMMRIVLDRCATVDEAIALVSSFRVWFSDEWLHFLVADAAGNKAVFEFDERGRLATVKPGPGEAFLLSTNTALSGDPLRPYWDCPRYAAGQASLRSALPADMGELRAFMLRLSPNPSNADLYRGWGEKNKAKALARGQTRWESFYDLSRLRMELFPSGESLMKGYSFGFD